MDSYQPGNTIEFTWTSSLPPDSPPILTIWDGRDDAMVASITSVQSDSTHYSALYTCPNSDGFYMGEWLAQKTLSSSLRNFMNRFNFRVDKTTPVP